MFFLQLGIALKKAGLQRENGIAFNVPPALSSEALGLLPFAPTGVQKRVISQLAADMAKPEPMHRLVQGDVGSGKTAVAMVAAALAVKNGYQVAVMAPTEILAEQHHRNFSQWFEKQGVHVALITGTGSAASKRNQRASVSEGRSAVAVGTHALLEGSVYFHRLGLVVVDEQHRFGCVAKTHIDVERHPSRCVGDDGDSDTENVGDDALWRPGRVGHR